MAHSLDGAALSDPVMHGAPDPNLLPVFTTAVSELRNHLTCRICLKLLYEPYTTPCGHTFCYECLNQWLASTSSGGKKSCPDCRARIKTQPAPAYLIKDMVSVLCKDDRLLPENEGVDEHRGMREDMAELVERHRRNEGQTGGLFEGRFKVAERRPAIWDEMDHMWRCPRCVQELEDGYCNGCRQSWDEDGEPVERSSFSNEDGSDTTSQSGESRPISELIDDEADIDDDESLSSLDLSDGGVNPRLYSAAARRYPYTYMLGVNDGDFSARRYFGHREATPSSDRSYDSDDSSQSDVSDLIDDADSDDDERISDLHATDSENVDGNTSCDNGSQMAVRGVPYEDGNDVTTSAPQARELSQPYHDAHEEVASNTTDAFEVNNFSEVDDDGEEADQNVEDESDTTNGVDGYNQAGIGSCTDEHEVDREGDFVDGNNQAGTGYVGDGDESTIEPVTPPRALHKRARVVLSDDSEDDVDHEEVARVARRRRLVASPDSTPESDEERASRQAMVSQIQSGSRNAPVVLNSSDNEEDEEDEELVHIASGRSSRQQKPKFHDTATTLRASHAPYRTVPTADSDDDDDEEEDSGDHKSTHDPEDGDEGDNWGEQAEEGEEEDDECEDEDEEPIRPAARRRVVTSRRPPSRATRAGPGIPAQSRQGRDRKRARLQVMDGSHSQGNRRVHVRA